MRTRLVALLLTVVGLVLIPSTVALAQTDPSTPGSSTPNSATATTVVPPIPIPPDGVDIGGGNRTTGAVITLNGDASSPRTLNAYQAAVFLQAWLPYALVTQNPRIEDPPAQLPVYRVDITGTWGSTGPTGTVAVYYASDGTTAWISFPDNQPPAPEPISPPPPSHWFVAPQRTIDGFNGTGTLVQTEGVVAATAPTLPPGEAKSGSGSGSGSGSSSTAIWVALLVGLLIVLLVGGFILRRRRAGNESDQVTEDTKARVDAK
jgi:hypothetical protein